MYNYTLSLVFGFIAMACAMSSYFVKNKKFFMFLQTGAIICLAFSTLFIENFYAMFSYFLSITRVITYQVLENKGKKVSFWLMSVFALLNIICFACLNIKTFKALDIMFMIGAVLYSYAFGIKNMKFLRLFFLLPTGLSVLYFVLTNATVFVIISYCFEFVANLVALVYYYIKENRTQEIKIGKDNK